MALANCYLDLVAPTGPSALADFLGEHGEAPFEMVIEVTDLMATSRVLRDRGISVTESTQADGAAELRVEAKEAVGVRLVLRQRGGLKN
jgi:hypothetical protein